MSEIETAENLAGNLGRRQVDALRALRFFGGEANGGSICDLTGIPSGSSTHHFDTLRERNLINHEGWEHVGKGGSSKVWKLTARGEAVVSELADSEPTIDEIDDAVDEVEENSDRLDELEERHEAEIEEVEEEIERLSKQYDKIQGLLEDVQEYFEDEEDEEGEGF